MSFNGMVDVVGGAAKVALTGNGGGEYAVIGSVRLLGDARPSLMKSQDVTLGLADAVTSINVPAGARGFVIKNASARVRIMLNADPPAAYSTGSLGNYNSVNTNEIHVRIFDVAEGAATLRINSETASATLTVEFF